ncbi:ABC transporter permease [Rubellimicrobium roseum]|nr:ABC transporter permease [Rubellimicrobium roseum]
MLTQPVPATPAARPLRRTLARALLSDWFVLWLTLAYFLILLPVLPTLGTPANLANLLSNAWPLLVVALGQTFVMTIGGIDLSQGAVIGLTSTLGAALIATAGPPEVLSKAPIWGLLIFEDGGVLAGQLWLGLLAMLLAGALVGLVNGTLVAWLDMPAFMVTLVSLITVGAFAIWLTQSENIRNLPDSYVALGKGEIVSVYIGPKEEPQIPRRQVHELVTYAALVAVTLAVALHLLLERTAFGRQVLAVGANRRAAEIAGVPVRRIIVLVFVLSSLCATVGAVLYSARLEAGRPTLGEGTFLLDVIGATVIGGTSLFGGKGKVLWTVFGVLFFVLLSNSLNLMNLSTFHIDMVKGGVILAAALLDVARTRLLRGMA